MNRSCWFGWGHYVQYPGPDALFGRFGGPALLPERSIHYVISMERRLEERTLLRAEFYDREDRDLLFPPFYEPRLVDGRIVSPALDPPWSNSQRGYARGVEIFLQRRSANRLAGWISYAYCRARLRDGALHVAFPSDFDQRHTASVYASYRPRSSVNLSAKLLYGSGVPVPGFLRQVGSVYYLDAGRNGLRLGPYHRADVRINKSWAYDRCKMDAGPDVPYPAIAGSGVREVTREEKREKD